MTSILNSDNIVRHCCANETLAPLHCPMVLRVQIGFQHTCFEGDDDAAENGALFLHDSTYAASTSCGGRDMESKLFISKPMPWPTLTSKFVLQYTKQLLQAKTTAEQPGVMLAIGGWIG
jgi:hypothetical protein